MNALYHLIRADFLERARRYSFLITLGLALYLGYAVNAGQITLRLDQYRGVFNSAWVGSMMTLVVNFFLGWFGFYLVKNAIARDYETGVGQIMATTPLSRPVYTLGKWLSNFVVLGVMVILLMLAAVVMQFIGREDPQFNLWALLAPFLFVALPFMALVAALAVLFETLSWLRGGFGNVAYFFLFMMLISVVTIVFGPKVPVLDLIGFGLFSTSMGAAVKAEYPAYDGGFALGLMPPGDLKTFYWPGVEWTGTIILTRLVTLGIAIGIALLAAIFFDRFDPSREARREKKPGKSKITQVTEVAETEVATASASPPAVYLTPLSRARSANRLGLFGRTLIAELRLMLNGTPWWWYAIAGMLVVGAIASPTNLIRQAWLPLAWVWPLLLWSQLGARERRWQTGPMVFSAAAPISRQLPALWAAGLLLAMLTGSGAAAHFGMTGQWTLLGAWTAGVIFIPSLALVLGTWSGSSKAFEVIYILWWYLGPWSGLAALDYIGARDAALAGRMPLVYLVASSALLALAIVGRRRAMHG